MGILILPVLAYVIGNRCSWEYTGRAAGCIVDTPSSFASSSGVHNDHRYTLIKACVDAFKSMFPFNLYHKFLHLTSCAVNVILVVGHEKLNVEMQRIYGGRFTVLKIPKSGGVGRFQSCTLSLRFRLFLIST